jgi:RimJ/RimL family protein N-acetyltransferase
MSVLDTDNLSGRVLTEHDLPFVTGVWNDERVAPTIGGLRDEHQLSDRIERWTRHWKDHGFGVTLFHERSTGQPIGWGGLQYSSIGIGERLTVGYLIKPDAWGRGYATEIAIASVAHAFGGLAIDHVYASVQSTNAASRRVLEKAGLSVHCEIDHGEHTEVIYVVSCDSPKAVGRTSPRTRT